MPYPSRLTSISPDPISPKYFEEITGYDLKKTKKMTKMGFGITVFELHASDWI